MLKNFLGSNIAMVGGGKFCKLFLDSLYSDLFKDQRPAVIGVADVNGRAEGLQYAQKLGIFTTSDYSEIYQLENLQILIELTNDATIGDVIRKKKPDGVRLIDHVEARSLWGELQLEAEKRRTLNELQLKNYTVSAVESLIENFADRLGAVIKKRTDRYVEIEKELIESERALSQIIEGSTIPTFVVNQEHVLTHWNKAIENLSGFSAGKMVGTRDQSVPFWGKVRPTMADVILDQIGAEDIQKLYAGEWRKSALIGGAYEAETFLPKIGKWCWFTAAPIKAPDGRIVGAIETIWDKSEDKKAQEEREKHTRELSILCSIYSTLNAPLALEARIHQTAQEIKNFLYADGICIYLLEGDGKYYQRYCYGLTPEAARKVSVADETSTIYRVAQDNEYKIYEDLPDGCVDEICFLEEEKLVSLAYIPISSKAKKALGVIRVGSKTAGHFSHDLKSVLELIGNRLGVAIENVMLQDQYIKSEEKYRSLFNNDPNPIFILDNQTFSILDTNLRAQDSYGYSRQELLGVPFFQLGDENDEEVAEGLNHISEDQTILFPKKRHYRKDGQPFYVNVSISYAKYGESNVVIASTTDITESVEKETQLIQAGKMTTLGVMAAGIAHEINQPLNVIQVCADFFLKMLKRGQPIQDEDLKTMAGDIVSNVERAAGVIKHVRDFARQSEVVKSKVNINDPIQDVFKVLGHQLKVHEIEVELDLDQNVPNIMAEHNRLEQVFINLVTNAIDAMDEKSEQHATGSTEKRLVIKSFAENGQVTVNVSDTGIGMSEEIKNKILEPFFTTKKTGKGTGLGVSISYGIIKDYEGTIEIESEVGQGTTFKLTFPALTP
jgi:PAS domain S-box-containing protein